MAFGGHSDSASSIIHFIQRRKSGHLLITGLSGSGKTFLAKKIAEHLGLAYSYHLCSELFSAEIGETERELASIILDEGVRIVILDLVETIACAVSSPIGPEVEHRLNTVLKYCLDNTKAIVIGITSSPELLDTAFTRSGRFGDVVNVSISKTTQRYLLLREMTADGLFMDEELDYIAKKTHGFTAADLEKLFAVAFQSSLQRSRNDLELIDLENALNEIRPSTMIGLPMIKKRSNTRVLIGLSDLKTKILTLIRCPLEHADRYKQLRLAPVRGVLLWGPNGSGKTSLALQCAQESGLNIVHVEATSIRSKYVGQSEKNLVQVFKRARECAPCILFLDQLDGLFSVRGADSSTSQNTSDRLIACLLTELDGLASRRFGDGIFIIATSTTTTSIDPAVLRPGRIGIHFRMPSFDATLRTEFIDEAMTRIPLAIDKTQIKGLVDLTENYSAADMENILREAALRTIRSDPNSNEIPFQAIIEQLKLK